VLAFEAEPGEGPLPREQRFVDCAGGGVVVDTVKPAEDGEGVVLRLYESHGAHARATLLFARPIESVDVVNLLEEPLAGGAREALVLEQDGDNCLSLRMRPFQVASLRVRSRK
jgi:alpha-mannosidase